MKGEATAKLEAAKRQVQEARDRLNLAIENLIAVQVSNEDQEARP